jgi:alcohol dehydrogenase class IV
LCRAGRDKGKSVIEKFTMACAGTVHFGLGVLETVIGETKAFGTRALLVTGRSSVYKSGMLEKVTNLLEVLGVEVKLFGGVSANPTLGKVKEGVNFGRSEKVDMVIGFGGGSAMDTAKAIAAAIPSEYSIYEMFNSPDKAPIKNNVLPIIAIPTTAGSGSELSMGAILTDEENKKKGGLRSRHIIPMLAIIDPELTVSMPPHVTAESGFDVFTHALESYLSGARTPITELFSEKALYICGKYLTCSIQNGEDREAREQMSLASMLMGFNLANSSTCLPHRMQYPLAVHTGVGHGKGLAALYTAWLNCVQKAVQERLEIALKIWGGANYNGIRSVTEWIDKLGLPVSVSQLKVNPDMCLTMADEVSGYLALDPCYRDKNTIISIYRDSLDSQV